MQSVTNVTAIIVTYQSAAVVEFCIKALLKQGATVLVVDNNSDDGSVDIALAAGARVLLAPRNIGFGAACNLGAQHAETDWLLFINPDACPCIGTLDGLLQATLDYPEAGLFGPRITEPNGRVFFQSRSLLAAKLENPKGIQCVPDGDCCVPHISGACMFMRRDYFHELGGFDPNIFLYYEDDDLCRRILDRGKAVIWLSGVEVTHMRGKSTAQSYRATFLRRSNLAWSRAYVCRKYGIKDNNVATFIINLVKWLIAILTLNRNRVARYGGTCFGIWRALRSKSRPA